MTAVHPQHCKPEFVSVYSGPIGVAHTMRATLESAGFFAFIPFDNTKTLHPFSTGANSLDASVQVATADAEAVRDFMTVTTTARLPENTEGDETELERDARSTALHIRWGLAIQMMLAAVPVPWFFALRYFRLVARMKGVPSGHSFICAVLLFSAAIFALSSWAMWVFVHSE